MKKAFISLLFLMLFAQGAILPEIEWELPEKWQVVKLENKESPYVILTGTKEKIMVFRYRWHEDLLWSVSKSWRSSIALPILTKAELKSELVELENGTFFYSFAHENKQLAGAFYRLLGNLWVFKYSHNRVTSDQMKALQVFVQSVKEGQGLSKYVEKLSEKATSGNKDAQIELAEFLLEGRGLDYDSKKAFELLYKARAEGVANASFRLALLAQEQGELNTCLKFLEEGANKNHLPSLKKLSGLLLELKNDYQSAVQFLTIAAELGDSEAMHYLGEIYANNKRLKNPQKAFKWINMAAQKSYSPSLVTLAGFYRNGVGTEVDYGKALSLLRQAAQNNNSQAFEGLGDMILQGEGVDKDAQQALAYYVKATVEGSSTSLVKIADMYLQGVGVEKNTEQALSLLNESARRGAAPAMNRLADLFTKGVFVKEDPKAAYSWYLKSAQVGDSEGMFGLSLALFAGKGVPKDKFEAVKWMKLAASKGHATAEKMLMDTGFIKQ